MKKRKSLVLSIMAIVVCFTMLLGTTYAWFTDSVVNTNNIIKSGNVDVELYHKSNSDTTYSEVGGTTKLFVNQNGGEILWEPGASATETFKIENAGSLALKYEFTIKAVSKTISENEKSLTDILTLKVLGDDVDYEAIFANGYIVSGELLAGASEEYAVTIKWNSTENDNDFANLKILLGIELVATQYSYEYDGNGNGFDDLAIFPNVSSLVDFDALTQGQDVILETKGENSVSAKLSTGLVEELKNNGIEKVSLIHTDPIVENGKITLVYLFLIMQYK